jgi:hypothetical protein
MKRRPSFDFMARPDQRPVRETEGDLTRRLLETFQPHEQAMRDAQGIEVATTASAGAFLAKVEQSRSTERAKVRAYALSAIEANADAMGALVASVTPADVEHRVTAVDTQLRTLQVEHLKEAALAKAERERGNAGFWTWVNKSGAKQRSSPWPTPVLYVLLVLLAAGVEASVAADVLAGPPIVGLPSPLLLGVFFAFISVLVGLALAVGHMFAADARPPLRRAGFALIALAVVVWGVLAILSTHMRASIEAGGSGTVDEILASLHRGKFRPLVSIVALLLIAASAATTLVMWYKTVGFWGAPFGHRSKDKERLWCLLRLHEAEECQKSSIKARVRPAISALDALNDEAWKPANDALRLERELILIITHARESERAIDRAHAVVLTAYATTFRRIRPSADLTGVLVLSSDPPETLGEPATLHLQVQALQAAAGAVDDAVRAGKLHLHEAELQHLAQVDRLYAETRPSVTAEPAPHPALVFAPRIP